MAALNTQTDGRIPTAESHEVSFEVGESPDEGVSWRVPNRLMMRNAKRRLNRTKPKRSRIQRGKSRPGPKSDWLGEFREVAE